MVDAQQPIPIYYQLKQLLLEGIIEGRYGPGDRLPTEHELCELYGISRTPVTRALTELAEEGVILRQRRKGTFVNPHWQRRPAAGVEVRVVVSDEAWAEQIRHSSPAGIDINVVTVGFPDLHRTLTRAVGEGRAPDLAIIDSVWVAEFAEAGFLTPLDELDPQWVAREFTEDFLTPFVTGYRHHGQIYAVPEEANVAGLWSRADVLDRLSLEIPRTWDEMLAALAAVQSANGGTVPLAMPAGFKAGETTTYCLLSILAANGVEVIGSGAVRLDCAGTVEALRFIRRLVEEGYLLTDSVTYDCDHAPLLLARGDAAFSGGGSYEAGVIAATSGIDMTDVPEHFVFTPFPGGPRGEPAAVVGGMVYVIFRQSAYPKLAMRVLEHLASSPELQRRTELSGRIPPRRSIIQRVATTDPFIADTAAVLERAIVRPHTSLYHLVSAQLQTMLVSVVTGRLRPAAAAERTAELIGAITGLPVSHG